MAIRFETAAPMDPAAAQGAGRAQVMQQNNPTIAGLMKAVSDAYQQRAALGIAQQRNNQGYGGGHGGRGGGGDADQSQINELTAKENMAAQAVGGRIEEANIQQQGLQYRQNQEFSQNDRIKLQKYQAAMGWLESQDIPESNKNEMAAMIGNGSTLLQARESQGKQKWYAENEAAAARKNKFAADSQNQMDEILAGKMPSKVGTLYAPEIQAEVLSELSQDPSFQQMHPAQQKEIINKQTRERGGMLGYYTTDANGKIIALETPGSKQAKKDATEKPYDSVKAEKDISSIANRLYPLPKSSDLAPEDKQTAHDEYVLTRLFADRLKHKDVDPTEVATTLRDYVATLGKTDAEKATWDSEGGIRRQQKYQQLARAAGLDKVAGQGGGQQQQPAPQQSSGEAPPRPKGDAVLNAMNSELDDGMKEISAMPNATDKEKSQAAAVLDDSKRILAAVGGDVSKLNAAQKDRMLRNRQYLQSLFDKSVPPPPPAPSMRQGPRPVGKLAGS